MFGWETLRGMRNDFVESERWIGLSFHDDIQDLATCIDLNKRNMSMCGEYVEYLSSLDSLSGCRKASNHANNLLELLVVVRRRHILVTVTT